MAPTFLAALHFASGRLESKEAVVDCARNRIDGIRFADNTDFFAYSNLADRTVESRSCCAEGIA